MSTTDEEVRDQIMEAAREVGYMPRYYPEERTVGIIAPAKVCRFIEKIQNRMVRLLDSRPRQDLNP